MEQDTKAGDVAYSLTSPSELKTYPAMRNCAYLEIPPVFDQFGYSKDQEDKLRDAEIDTLMKVLCSGVGE